MCAMKPSLSRQPSLHRDGGIHRPVLWPQFPHTLAVCPPQGHVHSSSVKGGDLKLMICGVTLIDLKL